MSLPGGACGSDKWSPSAVKRKTEHHETGGNVCRSLEMFCGGGREGPISIYVDLTLLLSPGPTRSK